MIPAYIVKDLSGSRWSLQLVSTTHDGASRVVAAVSGLTIEARR